MRMTDDGTAVLMVHASADSAKRTQKWRDDMCAWFSSEADFRQEVDIDGDAKSGQLVFPEFDEGIHVVLPERIPRRLCCYCSIDPHQRTPTAVLWVGIDDMEDVWIYRELWPSKVYGIDKTLRDTDEDTKYKHWEVAETIALLEGNKLEWHNRGLANEYAIYRQQEKGEKIVSRFMDQAAKGFAAEMDEDSKTSIAQSFQQYGIQCSDPVKQHAAGYDLIHRVLAPRHHAQYGEWPKLHISSECHEIILEFKRMRYKERSPSQLMEEELWQRGVKARRHCLDNLRYILCANPFYNSNLASSRYDIRRH